MLWECSGVRMYLYRPQDTMLKNMVASLAPSKCHSMIYHTIATVIKLKRCLHFSRVSTLNFGWTTFLIFQMTCHRTYFTHIP